jgi:hypothetical protein
MTTPEQWRIGIERKQRVHAALRKLDELIVWLEAVWSE